jgi:hypothetical protein
MKRMKLLFTIALPVMLLQNAQAQSSRLIARADYLNNLTTFELQDTAVYAYSDGRGGDLNHPMMFDMSMTWNNTDTGLVNGTIVDQTFDALGRLTEVTTQTWSAAAGSYAPTSNVLYFYTNTSMPMQLTSIVSQTPSGGSWANYSEDQYSYYGGGNMLQSDLYLLWNGTTAMFDEQSEKQYYYGSNNLISSENDVTFTYTAGVGYVPSNSKLYTYTYAGTTPPMSNWLASKTYSTYTLGVPNPVNVTTNTYDSSGDMLTQSYQTYVSGSPVNNTLKVFGGFNAAQEATMEIDQNWVASSSSTGGSYDTVRMFTYMYNSPYNQMTQLLGESWNVAGFWEFAANDPMSNFYYETYTPSTGVNNVTNNNGTANIYPNPAQNTVNINLTWNEAQPFTVSVFDMKGAIVTAFSVPTTAQYTGSFSVDNYNSGIYIVRISGAKGTITQEVVVAH